MSRSRERPPERPALDRFHAAGGSTGARDMTPAVGTRGEPARWRRAVEGAAVALHRGGFADARWSYLYGDDTRYRARDADGAAVAEAARRMRGGRELPVEVQGPVIHPAVWTWEVPLYFWFGGIASGSSFVALAADLSGDRRSAALARKVTLAAAAPCAPLLISDLGRPERFLHMLRIFKPRSPMSMGAWCLAAFSNAAAGAVAADLAGRRRTATALGAATAALGTYLGSYTGVLLASTAVPVWSRSRTLLPPIFVCTATATGAAANRLALAATRRKKGSDPFLTFLSLGRVEAAAMAAELVLAAVNERRLGPLAQALDEGRPGGLMRAAKWAARGGLALRVARRFARRRPAAAADHAASALFLAAGLATRYAWVGAGRASATDDEGVARDARRGGPSAAGR